VSWIANAVDFDGEQHIRLVSDPSPADPRTLECTRTALPALAPIVEPPYLKNVDLPWPPLWGIPTAFMDEPDLEDDPFVLPGAMPLLLLGDIFHFPGCDLPLRVSHEIQSTMVEYAMEHDKMFAVGCSSEAGTLFPAVTAGTIKSVFEFADGSSELVLFGIQRMRVVGLNQLKPFPIVRVEPIPYSPVSPEAFDDWQELLVDMLESRATGWDDFFAQISDWVRRMEDPARICDIVGNHLIRSRKILRELLSEENTVKRMDIVFNALSDQEIES
jgi:ATP-dependent Lon protease